MKTCTNCGAEIKDAEFLIQHGYKEAAKLCENCRREKRAYRQEDVVERSLLREWRGVKIDNILLDFCKSPQKGKDKYYVFSWGGANYGGSWSGVVHNGREFVYVHRALVEDRSVVLGSIVNIREMVKVSQKTGKHEYYVLEPCSTHANLFLSYKREYSKTTLKGLGTDKSSNPVVDGRIENVSVCWSGCRSGRYETTITHFIAQDEYKVEEE